MDRNMAYAGVSVVLAGMLGFSWAQGRGGLAADEPKPMTQDIAVVDIGKIYEKHKRFQAKSEDFKRANQQAQEKLNALAQAGQKLKSELDQQKPGSSDYARVQKELAEKQAEFQKYQKEQAERFQKEQTEAISVTYQEIVEEIQRIAEARGFRLVLRYQVELPDPKNPLKLAELVNRQILYQNGLDITEEVLQAFNN
jgi:Skp family chaperone for outer membrane proteins